MSLRSSGTTGCARLLAGGSVSERGLVVVDDLGRRRVRQRFGARLVVPVAARDGWDATNAVINGNVIAIDDDIASRWGPRLVDFIQAVSTALSKVPAQA